MQRRGRQRILVCRRRDPISAIDPILLVRSRHRMVYHPPGTGVGEFPTIPILTFGLGVKSSLRVRIVDRPPDLISAIKDCAGRGLWSSLLIVDPVNSLAAPEGGEGHPDGPIWIWPGNLPIHPGVESKSTADDPAIDPKHPAQERDRRGDPLALGRLLHHEKSVHVHRLLDDDPEMLREGPQNDSLSC